MEQRLTLIDKITNPQYAEGSPLLLEACALYLDNVEKQCIAQLKWKNIGNQVIQAILIDLVCFDAFGHVTKTQSYQYDRLNVAKGQFCGGKTAIPLGHDKINKYEVVLKAVSYENGTVQEYPALAAYKPLPADKPQELTGDLLAQYKRDLAQQGIRTTVLVNHQSASGLWQCVCKSWQMDGEPCLACRAEQATLISVATLDVVEANLARYQEEKRKDNLYDTAKRKMEQHKESEYKEAISLLESIPGWRDAERLILVCQSKLREIEERQASERRARERAAEEARIQARKRKRRRNAFIVLVLLAIAGYFAVTEYVIPQQKYDAAMVLKNEAKYSEAITAFAALEGYRDSEEQIVACETAILDANYDAAVALMNEGKYSEAISAFSAIKEHRDSEAQIAVCRTAILDGLYDDAVVLMNAGKYSEAIKVFTQIKTHRDSDEQIAACETAILDGKYNAAVALMNEGRYNEAIQAFTAIKTHKDSTAQIKACETAILDGKYDAAVALMNEGKYLKAYNTFVEIKDHKDSTAKAISIYDKALKEHYSNATVGSYITFGTYEQDNNTSNGKEDIEWLVLGKENNRMLVISRYALDCKPYNEKTTNVTWETCTLRKWLNNDFLKAAFSTTEQAMIPTVTVSADKNPDYSTKPGNATQDKVFLLSIPEVNKYFTSDSARQCKLTAYAKKQGAKRNNSGFCWWWLRSPGYFQFYAAHVSYGGVVDEGGDDVGDDSDAVRPALWINLEP